MYEVHNPECVYVCECVCVCVRAYVRVCVPPSDSSGTIEVIIVKRGMVPASDMVMHQDRCLTSVPCLMAGA